MPGTGLLSMAAPRKPEDLFQEDLLPPEPIEPIELIDALRLMDGSNESELRGMESEEFPQTPRRSFYTWIYNVPSGVPAPPSFRLHVRHVMCLQDFLQDVEASPTKLEICVARARRRDGDHFEMKRTVAATWKDQ